MVKIEEGETYDVIFMDMSMPRMDGLEATRLIRTAKGPQPHIIALTADWLASIISGGFPPVSRMLASRACRAMAIR